MGASYSRSNIGRISLNAGRKLGGAPTVNRSSAYAGGNVLAIARAPAQAASTILNPRMFTLNSPFGRMFRSRTLSCPSAQDYRKVRRPSMLTCGVDRLLDCRLSILTVFSQRLYTYTSRRRSERRDDFSRESPSRRGTMWTLLA